MSRPSRNVDEQLLRAGRELFPQAGCAGLSVRKVAEQAGANPGMFHYHFRTKDAFVRRLLQDIYDRMFTALELAAATGETPLEALTQAIRVIAHFGRAHRHLLRRIIADAMDGQPIAIEFLRTNLPRHFSVIVALIGTAQDAGCLRRLPIAQAVAFVAGAVGAPIVFGSGFAEGDLANPAVATTFAADVLSDPAIDERIGLALAALATVSEAGA